MNTVVIVLWILISPEVLRAQLQHFQLPNNGEVSFEGIGAAQQTIGYARIQAREKTGDYGLPAGLAIFAFRQNGVLVSEASVAAAPLINSGRIYAEVAESVNTGIAIANPNGQSVTVNFYFTDSAGNTFGQGVTMIGPNSQIAAFLNEAPFSASGVVRGTFTFTSSLLVSVIALRGVTNERNEFLMTTLPVNTIANVFPSRLTIPHFANGGGWETTIVLVNPSDAAITGELRAYSPAGQALAITLNGAAGTSFPYTIPPRSAAAFRGSRAAPAAQVGFVSVESSQASSRAHAFAMFDYSVNGVRVTQASVLAESAGAAWSMFVESRDDAGGQIRTRSGVAIANNGSSQTTGVHFELFGADGVFLGRSAGITTPPLWQMAVFLDEIPGLPLVSGAFKGTLRIVASGDRFNPGAVSVTGLRGRHNERGEFIITTTQPVQEVFGTGSSELLFPHFVIGGGYTTQFVLFTDRGASGTVYFFDQSGRAIVLNTR